MTLKKTADLFFQIIYWLFFALVAVIALFLVLTKFPSLGGFKAMVVLSGSMEPNIHTGSIVVIKKAKQYQPGEVITFRLDKKTTITHRIKEVKRATNGNIAAYITKGDANEDVDLAPVPPYRVLGRVLFSVPWAGYAVETVRRPLGFLIVIVVPAAIVIIDETRKIVREVKRIRNKEKN